MLVRMDSGFDAGKLFAAIDAASQARQADGGAPIEALGEVESAQWRRRDGDRGRARRSRRSNGPRPARASA
ncbi:MAG: hypothetical protein U5L11_04980 [Arhodomonas sp.]|nr:hypothetical protein [Arhodomonas sp.]